MPEGIEQYIKKLAQEAFADLEKGDIKEAKQRVILIINATKHKWFKKEYENKEINDLAKQILKLLKEVNFRKAEDLLMEIYSKIGINSEEFERRKMQLIRWGFRYDVYPKLGNFLIAHWETVENIGAIEKEVLGDELFLHYLPNFESTGVIINERTWPMIVEFFIKLIKGIDKSLIYYLYFRNIFSELIFYLYEIGVTKKKGWEDMVVKVVNGLGKEYIGIFILVLTKIDKKLFLNLDSYRIIESVKSMVHSPLYHTVQGLSSLGYLCCHVTNAFASESQRRDPFENIVFCIENQGTNRFQLSSSAIHPKLKSGIVVSEAFRIKGSIGIIFDSGYIYELSQVDTFTHAVGKGERTYKTGLKEEMSFGVALNVERAKYNELLVRAYTVGGLFYTKGVQQEVIEKLKEIADMYSHKEYISPEWINRTEKYGVPQYKTKVYSIYEIDSDNIKWKIVYIPKKLDIAKAA